MKIVPYLSNAIRSVFQKKHLTAIFGVIMAALGGAILLVPYLSKISLVLSTGWGLILGAVALFFVWWYKFRNMVRINFGRTFIYGKNQPNIYADVSPEMSSIVLFDKIKDAIEREFERPPMMALTEYDKDLEYRAFQLLDDNWENILVDMIQGGVPVAAANLFKDKTLHLNDAIEYSITMIRSMVCVGNYENFLIKILDSPPATLDKNSVFLKILDGLGEKFPTSLLAKIKSICPDLLVRIIENATVPDDKVSHSLVKKLASIGVAVSYGSKTGVVK